MTASHPLLMARSFLGAHRPFRHRAALERWQVRQLRRFLRDDLARVPFYAAHPGRLHQPATRAERASPSAWLAGLPIVDKASMLADFAAFNSAGVTLEQARAVASQAERERDFTPLLPGGLTVGLSSGTTGQPGVFLVSPEERARWAGVTLARLLPAATLRRLLAPWRAPLRVAFFLRANSNLYTTVQSRRLDFAWYDLQAPFAAHLDGLNTNPPDLLIAPASVLHALAQAQRAGQLRIAPRQIVSVAEVLEPDDAQAVAATWGVVPGQVYQCTEGFLAATCPAGRLHLNEGHLHVEPQWLDESHTRFVPLITDFTRRTQAFVRYRLDDVLRVAHEPCPCGRVTLALAAVEGRCDDQLWGRRADGSAAPVFADALRHALLHAQQAAGFDDYQLVQQGETLTLALPLPQPDALAATQAELQALARRLELQLPPLQAGVWQPPAPGAKRRRIRCLTPVAPLPSALETASCASS